jgi:adenylate cyclase
MLGYCRAIQLTHGWSVLSEDEIADSVRLARWALEILRNDPDTMIWASWTLLRLAGETALAATLLDRAVALNPNSALAWVSKGWFLAVRNRPDAAIEALERALSLNPFDPLGFFASTGLVLQLGFILKFLHHKDRKLLVEDPDIPSEVDGTRWISAVEKLRLR